MLKLFLFQAAMIVVACTLIYYGEPGLATVVCSSVVVAYAIADMMDDYDETGFIGWWLGSITLSWVATFVAAKPVEGVICSLTLTTPGWGQYSLSMVITSAVAYGIVLITRQLLEIVRLNKYSAAGWFLVVSVCSGLAAYCIGLYAVGLGFVCVLALLFGVFTHGDAPASWQSFSIAGLLIAILGAPILIAQEVGLYHWWYLLWVPVGVSLPIILATASDEYFAWVKR